jgi:transcriptional regulator with XRE-family HTH domain
VFRFGEAFAFVAAMRLGKETFGPVLRASRERRGVSLEQIAAETKLGIELWADLENNNLSRWPRQIYARSYVRDYAIRVGLDPDEVVNEFCRLFPDWGDRRAERVIRRQAAIVNHNLDWEDLPSKEQRRASDHSSGMPTIFARHRARIIGALFDLMVTLLYGYSGVLLGFGFWRSLAVAAITYHTVATLFSSHGFGLRVAGALIRVVSAMPVARRLLVSSRVEGA